jgi:hypothetical protein
LWVHTPNYRLLVASARYAAVLVFGVSVLLRALPEFAAYPYPIGYDVVNYYIPVVANFEEHWPSVVGQFPLYVSFLHLVSLAGPSAHSAVVGVAVAVFGIFGVSIFYAARFLLKLEVPWSTFLAVFVIFQMAVLRTAWDLHRDVFALAAMMFALSLIGRKGAGWEWKSAAIILALCALTVAADRMIGALFCMSLAAYALMSRNKSAGLYAAFSAGLFAALMVAASYSVSPLGNVNIMIGNALPVSESPDFYKPQNLLLMFIVVTGLLVPAAIIGFVRSRDAKLLKMPLIISLVGSFSWLAFPSSSALVADRWTVLAGIFLAIFAGYGIVHLIRRTKARLAIAGSVLAAFAIIGIAYAIMPYDNPFILYSAARASTENFMPPTMQFNALDVKDNGKLLSAIASINLSTEPDSVIIGEKHWRGFMEMHLEGQRTYRFSNNLPALVEASDRLGPHVYLFESDSDATFEVIRLEHNDRR